MFLLSSSVFQIPVRAFLPRICHASLSASIPVPATTDVPAPASASPSSSASSLLTTGRSTSRALSTREQPSSFIFPRTWDLADLLRHLDNHPPQRGRTYETHEAYCRIRADLQPVDRPDRLQDCCGGSSQGPRCRWIHVCRAIVCLLY